MAVKTSPGLYFAVAEPRPAPAPLRTDIAGFIGRALRGPVGAPVRVEGIRGFTNVFGSQTHASQTSYAVNSYFENGGEVAWMVRVARDSQTATGVVDGVETLGLQAAGAPPQTVATAIRIAASSPGTWANGMVVTVRYQQDNGAGKPSVDVIAQAPGLAPEYITGLDPANTDTTLSAQVATASLLTSIEVLPETAAAPVANAVARRSQQWTVTLSGGQDGSPSREEYRNAARALGDEPEPAIIAAPDLNCDFDAVSGAREDILGTLIARADQLIDRLVIVDIPKENWKVVDAIAWLNGMRVANGASMRAAAAYHPRLLLPDPLAVVGNPWRCVASSGSVAGVISQLDRERGAYYTPANAPIVDAADTDHQFTSDEEALLNQNGINVLRCFRGRGLYVWGGRTGSTDPSRQFVAHRRLIHRLVRAIRRVAEPLVFGTNGPELWLTFVRAITTVLLAAFRAGALQGARPEQAFQVTCDATTNPPEQVDNGMLVCLVQVAPAVPMEFILLRIALSGEGVLEVFEQ